MKSETKTRRRIRYALPERAGDDWGQSEDNPASPTFVPVGEPDRSGLDPLHGRPVRSEMARARWWALRGRRSRNPSSGVFD